MLGKTSGYFISTQLSKLASSKAQSLTTPTAASKNIVAAVHHDSGDFFSLIVPHNDKEVFQAFLDTFEHEVPAQEGKEIILVLDNASRHKTKNLTGHRSRGRRCFLRCCQRRCCG